MVPTRFAERSPQLLVVVALAAACSGACAGPDGASDAGTDAFTIAIDAPALPAAPTPPSLTPCPTGWREIPPANAEEVATCDPWPASGAASCGPGQAHFPGEPGCAPIGTACTAGEWATGLPVGVPILYVLQGVAPGGVGSMGDPFATVSEAINGAAPGTIIAISKGTFDEAVIVPAGVTLWGACTAETTLASLTPSPSTGTVATSSPDVVVRNLTVSGARPGFTVTDATATLHVQDVVISGVARVAIRVVAGATVTADTLAVLATAPDPVAGGTGFAVDLLAGSVTVTRAVLGGNTEAAMRARGVSSVLEVSDVAIVDTQSRPLDGALGVAIWVGQGAQLTAARLTMERNHAVAVIVTGNASTAAVTDVVVRDSEVATGSGFGGLAFEISFGASLDLQRAYLVGNRDAAINVLETGTSATLTDVVVADTGAADNGIGGNGLQVVDGATLTGSRLLISRSTTQGVLATGPGGSLNLADVTIFDTAPKVVTGAGGSGLVASEGISVSLVRAVFSRNHDAGLVAHGEGTVLVAEDVVVRDTLPEFLDGLRGHGLELGTGAVATIRRALLERNIEGGLMVAGAIATIEDLTVRDTESNPDGLYGWGLGIGEGAQVQVTRAVIERSRDVGVVLFHPSTWAVLSDVIVVNTRERACAITTCAGLGGGSGLAVIDGAVVDVTGFRISGNALAGVLLARGGEADLHFGEISFNLVGANVQTIGFVLSRLEDNVLYFDNGVNLDSDKLPVPDPISPL